MNSRLGVFLACGLGSVCSLVAMTVNDGTTTNNLVQITNSSTDSLGTASAHLDAVNSNAVLQAYQAGTSDSFALRSAWYASDVVATSGVYTVSADFLPAADTFANRGGVIGWLSLADSNGIALQVIPEAAQITFRLSVIDFSADNFADNDGFNHLFNTDGTPASETSGPALSPASPDYSSTNFATFQIAFSAPTQADLAALTNATAHITAKVLQATNAAGPQIQVSQPIELLTDLPRPEPALHRFGYFAFWGSVVNPGDIIGYLDNLSADGAIGAAPNTPPSVTITHPTSGATFARPANISIDTAVADSDGAVIKVDFFAGAMLLGTATNNPFTFTWNNASAGSYALTAQATDNRGGTATSAPVDITVTSSTGGGPIVTAVLGAGTIEISWGTIGYQLQMKADLSASTMWTDVPTNTVNTNRVTLASTSGNMFFRLIQVGAPPGGPTLAIQQSGNSIVVSWPAQVIAYGLQSKTDLNSATWTVITTSSNQFTEAISGGAKFYRLTKP